MSQLAVVPGTQPAHVVNTTLLLKVMSALTPETRWTSDWLHTNVRAPRRPFAFGPYQISYSGQPGGRGSEHEWQILSEDPRSATHLAEVIKAIRRRSQLPVLTPRPQPQSSGQEVPCRSLAEVKVAEVLEARGILFFANSRCRIRNRAGITLTREPDLLVFCGGQARILEIDGREYHPDPAQDHGRDRLFERYGLRTSRFTAQECLQDPEAVVDEFLALFQPL